MAFRCFFRSNDEESKNNAVFGQVIKDIQNLFGEGRAQEFNQKMQSKIDMGSPLTKGALMRFLKPEEVGSINSQDAKDNESTLNTRGSSSVIENKNSISITNNNQKVGAGRKSDPNGNAKQNSESKSSATYATKTEKDSGNTTQIKNNELEKKTAVASNSKSPQMQQNVPETQKALVNRGKRLKDVAEGGAELNGLAGDFRENTRALLKQTKQKNRNQKWWWPF